MDNNIFNIFSPNYEEDKEIIPLEQERDFRYLVKSLLVPIEDFHLEGWIFTFKKYAVPNQRIFYSIISDEVYNFKNEDKQLIDIANENMKAIFSFIEDDKQRKIFLKFYDHINLCKQQVDLVHQINELKSDSFHTEINKKLNSVHEKAEKQNEKVEKINNTLKSAQRDYVAVLGIFTAVILSFVSGSMFLNSSLNNVHQVDFWRVSFTSISVGMILLNILIALFIFIKKIVQDDSAFPKLSWVLNGVMFILLIVVGLFWKYDVGDFDKNVTFIKENKEHLQNHPHIKVFESQKHK